MKKIDAKYYFGAGVFLVVALFAWYFLQPGKLDGFASCISEQNATFYGAFWCPHCKEQKALFGKSTSKLPYAECSTPDGQQQTDICKEAGIQSYPTWEFTDGERVTGVMSLQDLADKTGCELPVS